MPSPATIVPPVDPRNPCPVYTLNTPRTRALMGLVLLRDEVRPRKRDRREAEIVAILAHIALSNVEVADMGPELGAEALHLYSKVTKACAKVTGHMPTLGEVASQPRRRAAVVDLAAFRAKRAARAS